MIRIAVYIVGKDDITGWERNQLWKHTEKNGFFLGVFYKTREEFEKDEYENKKKCQFTFFDRHGKSL